MRDTKPRYPKEEVARRGDEIYAKLKPIVDPGNTNKILAIDIDTGEYEIDENHMAAVDRLFDRLTEPQVYCVRIGHRAVTYFGWRGPA